MKTFEQALSDKRLNHTTFRLYICIWKNIQMTNTGFTKTNAEITDYLGISPATISNCIEQLIELGYVTKSKGQKINHNGQIVILNDGAYRTLHVTDNVEVKPKKVSKKKEEGIKTFEIFWNNKVKNKKGKETALKSWLRLTIEEQRLAYKMIGYYYKTVEDSKYYAHVSTWLNGKRFNDEDIIPSHEKKSGSRWNQHVEQTDEERAEKRRLAIKKLKENLDN
tara:strand:- start:948 stop:1613 length:666 start_codon:yes stop_codon:yes gene_type:complete